MVSFVLNSVGDLAMREGRGDIFKAECVDIVGLIQLNTISKLILDQDTLSTQLERSITIKLGI